MRTVELPELRLEELQWNAAQQDPSVVLEGEALQVAFALGLALDAGDLVRVGRGIDKFAGPRDHDVTRPWYVVEGLATDYKPGKYRLRHGPTPHSDWAIYARLEEITALKKPRR